MIARYKKCNKKIFKPVDYSKFKTILKRFKRKDLHLVLQKEIYMYEWMDYYAKMYELYLPSTKKE